MRSIMFVLTLACFTVTSAHAQMTFVNPTVGGGYTVSRPGQPPSFATPTIGGGYVINSPQQPRPSGGMYGSTPGGMYGR